VLVEQRAGGGVAGALCCLSLFTPQDWLAPLRLFNGKKTNMFPLMGG